MSPSCLTTAGLTLVPCGEDGEERSSQHFVVSPCSPQGDFHPQHEAWRSEQEKGIFTLCLVTIPMIHFMGDFLCQLVCVTRLLSQPKSGL